MDTPDLHIAKQAYDNYILRCNRAAAFDSTWWFTPSSSRERFGTQVQNRYFEFSNGQLFPYIEDATAKVTGKLSLRRLGILRFLIQFYRFLMLSLNLARHVWRNRAPPPEKQETRILFLRPLHALSYLFEGRLKPDHYFGELPGILAARGLNVEISGPPDPGVAGMRIIARADSIVIKNLFSYLGFADLVAWFGSASLQVFKHLQLPEARNVHEDFLRREIRREWRNTIYQRIIALSFKHAILAFLRKNPRAIIFHTFENNWWERSIHQARQQIGHREICYGFLHCSILMSHRKFAMIENESTITPMPDKIITTGKAASKILLMMGQYEAKMIIDGFDLRGAPRETPLRKQNVSVHRDNIRVLILLEGLNTMPEFLNLVIDSLATVDGIKLRVRTHPVYPITHPDFTATRNRPEFARIEISQGKSLEQDCMNTELAIYKGSTSAMYAANVGVPLLRYRDSWWFTDDPLSGCSALKIEFINGIELLAGIKKWRTSSPQFLKSEQQKARKYIESYLTPWQKANLQNFAFKRLKIC